MAHAAQGGEGGRPRCSAVRWACCCAPVLLRCCITVQLSGCPGMRNFLARGRRRTQHCKCRQPSPNQCTLMHVHITYPPAEASRSSSAFGGAQFWAALRGVDKLEAEVRGLLAEAKASIRRRGGQPLLVESDLKLARFLAGLHVSEEWEALLLHYGCIMRDCIMCGCTMCGGRMMAVASAVASAGGIGSGIGSAVLPCIVLCGWGLMAVAAPRISMHPSAAARCCRAGWRGGKCRTLSAGCCWRQSCCRWQRTGCLRLWRVPRWGRLNLESAKVLRSSGLSRLACAFSTCWCR